MKFTTKDQDNDMLGDGWNCATYTGKGGWWYNRCFQCNLNGPYAARNWTPLDHLQVTEMKIRPK